MIPKMRHVEFMCPASITQVRKLTVLLSCNTSHLLLLRGAQLSETRPCSGRLMLIQNKKPLRMFKDTGRKLALSTKLRKAEALYLMQ